MGRKSLFILFVSCVAAVALYASAGAQEPIGNQQVEIPGGLPAADVAPVDPLQEQMELLNEFEPYGPDDDRTQDSQVDLDGDGLTESDEQAMGSQDQPEELPPVCIISPALRGIFVPSDEDEGIPGEDYIVESPDGSVLEVIPEDQAIIITPDVVIYPPNKLFPYGFIVEPPIDGEDLDVEIGDMGQITYPDGGIISGINEEGELYFQWIEIDEDGETEIFGPYILDPGDRIDGSGNILPPDEIE